MAVRPAPESILLPVDRYFRKFIGSCVEVVAKRLLSYPGKSWRGGQAIDIEQ